RWSASNGARAPGTEAGEEPPEPDVEPGRGVAVRGAGLGTAALLGAAALLGRAPVVDAEGAGPGATGAVLGAIAPEGVAPGREGATSDPRAGGAVRGAGPGADGLEVARRTWTSSCAAADVAAPWAAEGRGVRPASPGVLAEVCDGEIGNRRRAGASGPSGRPAPGCTTGARRCPVPGSAWRRETERRTAPIPCAGPVAASEVPGRRAETEPGVVPARAAARVAPSLGLDAGTLVPGAGAPAGAVVDGVAAAEVPVVEASPGRGLGLRPGVVVDAEVDGAVVVDAVVVDAVVDGAVGFEAAEVDDAEVAVADDGGAGGVAGAALARVLAAEPRSSALSALDRRTSTPAWTGGASDAGAPAAATSPCARRAVGTGPSPE